MPSGSACRRRCTGRRGRCGLFQKIIEPARAKPIIISRLEPRTMAQISGASGASRVASRIEQLADETRQAAASRPWRWRPGRTCRPAASRWRWPAPARDGRAAVPRRCGDQVHEQEEGGARQRAVDDVVERRRRADAVEQPDRDQQIAHRGDDGEADEIAQIAAREHADGADEQRDERGRDDDRLDDGAERPASAPKIRP